jgi:hypothetical protein
MLQVEWPGDVDRYGPELVVTVIPQEYGEHYAVSVELRRDENGPYVVGVAVRRSVLAGYTGLRTHVSPRDVQRLPLARMVAAALAIASTATRPTGDERVQGSDPGPSPVATLVEGESAWVTYYDVGHADEWRELGFDLPPAMIEAGKILVPRGRPQRGKSVDFYRQLAKSYRAFELAGLSPVKEIARRKRVPENTVHQWIHRMRHELGFLEPSPRSKRRESTSG